ncbi:meiotic recombination protein SPO11 isoform X2 [Sigmodon hispidus]
MACAPAHSACRLPRGWWRSARARVDSQAWEASECLPVSAIMAFVPVGPEASFFDALDRHRASLLAMVKRGTGESPAGAARVASRYNSSAGQWKAVRDAAVRALPECSLPLTLHFDFKNPLSTSKGLIAGNLRYMEEDGTRVQCTCSATATAVSSNIQGIQNLVTDAKFLLIVEKDATFQRLLDDNFCSRMSPCIMVTGKGVPDLNTRLLVKRLWDTFHIPVFTLVDADPHGLLVDCQSEASVCQVLLERTGTLKTIHATCVHEHGSRLSAEGSVEQH